MRFLFFQAGFVAFLLGSQVVPVAAQSGDRRALEPWRKAYYGVLLYDQEKCRPTGFEPSGVATIRNAEEQLRKMAGPLASSTEEWTIKTKASDAARDGCRGAAKAFERSALSILRQSDEFEILKQVAPPPASAVAAVPAPAPAAPAASMSAPPAAAAPSVAQPRPSVAPVTAPPAVAATPGAPTQARPPAPAPTASAPQRPATPPQQAAAASASAPPENARLRRLSQSGAPEDLVLVVNVSPTAPNAARDLDGNVVFRSSRADACVFSPVAEDVSRAIAVERWFTTRNVRVGAAAFRACGDADFSQSDVGIGLRKDLGALQPRAAATLAALADASNLDMVVVESATDRRVAERVRVDARAANAQAIEAERAGIGYLVLETQSTISCMLTGEANRLWGQNIEPQLSELQRDLESRAPLRSVVSSPNDAFIAARRGECRLVVGGAADLKRMRAAAQRERMVHRVGAVWLAPAATDTPRVAEVPQAQGNIANERLRSLGSIGQPDDLLLLVNVAASAPSAARDLDNNVVFRLPRADICRQVDIATDVAWWVATERWFAAVPRRMTIVPTQFPTCSGSDPRQADGLILLRKDLSSLDTRSLGGLGALADANQLEAVVLESVADRATADRARGAARETNAQAIESGRAGVGYLVIENRSTTACLLAGEAQRTWSARIAQRAVDLQRDLGSRAALREVPSTPNDAFIAARRGECRIVVGEAADLKRLRGAIQREQLAHQVGAVWLDAPVVEAPKPETAAPIKAPAVNPQLDAILADGSPEDLVLLVNVTASAPNAARDLDDNIVFRRGRFELCRHADIASDVAWSIATERWLAENPRRITTNVAQLPPCAGRDSRQSDGALVKRQDLATMDARMHSGFAALADEKGLAVVVISSAADREAADRARALARDATASAIEAGRAGIGYVVVEKGATAACFTSTTVQTGWQRQIAAQGDALALDLGSRSALRPIFLTANEAFIAAGRGECRIVVGEAGDLGRILTAARRTQLAVVPGAIWLDASAPTAPSPTPAPATAPAAAPTPSPAAVITSSGTALQAPAALPKLPVFFEELEAGGNRGDVVLLVNVTTSAPNAVINLAGRVVFQNARADLCVVGAPSASLAHELAIERWFAERNVNAANIRRPPCAEQAFSAIDGILVRRDEAARMPDRLLEAVANQGAARNVTATVIVSFQDLQAQERERDAARTANIQGIESGRAGAGIVTFENNSSTACVAASGDVAMWSRLIVSATPGLIQELGQRTALETSAQDVDTAYLNAKRGTCRMIVGSAQQLAPVRAATARDRVAARVSATWFAAETIRDAEAALTAEREAAGRASVVNPPPTSFSPPAAQQAGIPPANQVSGTVASGSSQPASALPGRQSGNSGSELVQGKVNLVMGRAENRFGSCSIGMRLENLTTMFFQDYAPRVTIVDRDGNKLGDVSFGTRGENLRPNAVASSDGFTRNVTCDIVAQVVVSGWEFCKFQDRREQSICESVLNVVPSTGIPVIRR